MWIIVSIVTAAIFGPGHVFSSERHFATKEVCEAYMTMDAEELLEELRSADIDDAMLLDARCIQDDGSDPA
jgi:hypothetical protein